MVLYLDYWFLLPKKKKNPPVYQNMDPKGELQRLVIPCPSSIVGDHISNLGL